jgi:hypothetical protein
LIVVTSQNSNQKLENRDQIYTIVDNNKVSVDIILEDIKNLKDHIDLYGSMSVARSKWKDIPHTGLDFLSQRGARARINQDINNRIKYLNDVISITRFVFDLYSQKDQ